MSRDEACKVTSAGKHKERKPKKPHYIPRPWGKPYNYKCFQCPFTCMEKSHLYNHMKYSLCKNSLSLLIESDWPYKKGHVLPPLQGHGLHPAAKDPPEPGTPTDERQQRGAEGDADRPDGTGAEEEEPEAEVTTATMKEPSSNSRGDPPERSAKKPKEPEPEGLMADMLSLEDQLLRARSVDVGVQLKHYKLSKTCLGGPGLLPEQWRLLAAGHTKAKTEGAQGRVNTSIPCYPPPPNLVDYQDPGGLNLSVLGVGYPLSPSLFSYVNSAVPASVSAQTHAQLAQFPFLASAAQLMHPLSGTDRGLIPPRLYYPFLCEHAFGGSAGPSDTHKALKTSPDTVEAGSLSGFQPKVNLWKVPALRPGAAAAAGGLTSPQRESPDGVFSLGDKAPAPSREGKSSLGLKRAGGPGGTEQPAEKRPSTGFTLDLLRNVQTKSDQLLITGR